MSRLRAEPVFADPGLRRSVEGGRPTLAWVDLDALIANFGRVRDLLAPATRVLAVVKADAYGLGAVPVAAALEEAGAGWFGVATLEEGLQLRSGGIGGRILLLGGIFPEQAEAAVREDLTPVVYAPETVRALARASGDGPPVPVHLKVDTGMGRLGVPFAHLDAFLDACPEMSPGGRVEIEGVLTHLARADEEGESAGEATREQMRLFSDACARIRARGHEVLLRHAANSAATLHGRSGAEEIVRPGLALYGVDPMGRVPLEPVLHWSSRVLFLKEVRAGGTVGYGGTWRASGSRTIATLPVGYHDGYDCRLSAGGEVLVGGRRCPVAGRVSMDLLTVDVTRAGAVRVGDPAWLLGGPSGDDAPVGLAEMAETCGVIPYEVLCGIGRRVPRLYLRSGEVTAVRCIG